MQTFATLIAFACLFWSVLGFCFAFVHAFAGRDERASGSERSSIGWLIAAGVFLMVAK